MEYCNHKISVKKIKLNYLSISWESFDEKFWALSNGA